MESEVTVRVDGRLYTGRFEVQGGAVLVVRYGIDTKKAELGGARPEHLAPTVLTELVRDVLERKQRLKS